MVFKYENLHELDSILIKFQNCKPTAIQDLRKNYINKICDILGIDKSMDSIFDKSLTISQKTFIGICLIRLLCYRNESIWEWIPNEYRIKCFKIIKEFNNEILKIVRIDLSSESHVVVEKIREFESDFIKKFESINNSITSVNNVTNIRNEFMKSFKHYESFTLFFRKENLLISNKFDEIFEAIKEYNSSSLSNLYNNYENLIKLLNNFLNEYNGVNNLIANKSIVEIFQNISEVIKIDFGNSDVLKPANLKFSYLDRKYPLHYTNKKLYIKFNLSNEGPGCAFDVKISVECDDIKILNKEILLGSINPNQVIAAVSEGLINSTLDNKSPSILLKVEWTNYDKSNQYLEDIIDLKSQKSDIDWESLKSEQPFSLEAVETEDELVGRNEFIQKIQNKLSAKRIESLIIHGQKRVGKTSLANVINKKLSLESNNIVIALNVGDLNKISAEKFVNDLGNYIFEELKNNPNINFQLNKPKFEGAISPLLQIVKHINKVNGDLKIIIIIDEFDEIPSDLYKLTDIGKTFFHNIRSLSKESCVGFVLVGSENIEIIKQSTEMINKFENFKVDYFDKENYWNDFIDLVTKPLMNKIEYEKDAIVELFNRTEGNPFYTNLICGKVFDRAVENRNAFITKDDIISGINDSIKSIEANEVNHFWKDGIVKEVKAEIDMIETNRRKFLIGFALMAREKNSISKKNILNEHKFKNYIPINEILESYIHRGIIIDENDKIRIKPSLIEDWLIEKGFQSISTGFLDEDSVKILNEKEQKAFIKEEELIALSEKWGVYNGQKISSIEVRAWLNQFENNIEKRLMYKILLNLKFYSEQEVIEKLMIIHEKVLKQIKVFKKGKEISTREIILTNSTNIGKSGSIYLRKYAQENKIISDNIVEFGKLKAFIEQNERAQVILVVDDIIGTGKTQRDSIISKLNNDLKNLLIEKKIKLILSSICATNLGINNIKKSIDNIGLEYDIICADILDEKDKCFSDKSIFFESDEEINDGKNIAIKYGKKIQKSQPLGYDESQLAIVFFDNCPNNSLPIIWSRNDKEPKWFPLFERKHIY